MSTLRKKIIGQEHADTYYEGQLTCWFQLYRKQWIIFECKIYLVLCVANGSVVK